MPTLTSNSGSITVVDISDGGNPISLFSSNQTHTFSANKSGTVTAGDQSAFNSVISVFRGATQYSSTTSASPAANQFYIVSVTSSDTDWKFTANKSTGTISVDTGSGGIPTGTTETATSVTVVININGVTSNLNHVLSLSKSIAGETGGQGIQGVGGPVLSLSASRQTFSFANSTATSSTDGSVVLQVRTDNITSGAVTWQRSSAGGSFAAIDTTTPPTGYSFATFGGLALAQLTITAAGFGNVAYRTIQATRDTSVDEIAIVKLQDGDDGADGKDAVVVSISGNNVLKNNTGSTALTANVYVGGTVLTTTQHGELSYQWYKNAVSISSATSRAYTVTAGDVTDNGSEEYTCTVSGTYT